MTLRVTLHAYHSDPSLPQRDGVNISHAEIAARLRALDCPDLAVEFHDFSRLCQDRRYAEEVLSRNDCVLSNVGPHAHYYYYLREKFRLEFRILRDFRTALWSSYLLQEALCRPYLRAGDALITPSRYARELSRRIYPHLRQHPIFIFEPMFTGCGSHDRAAGGGTGKRRRITLGYVGRLSEDKNFPQLVDLLILLNREQPGRYRLLACGAIHSPSCDPVKVHTRLRARTGRSDLFEYQPPRKHTDIWRTYHRFDVFLFPSTSSLETLGRVLAEASHCGVPVLASEHAAAPELLAPEALSPVDYRLDKVYAMHFDHPLGSVDISNMARKLERSELVPAYCHLNYRNDPRFLEELLLGALKEGDGEYGPPRLTDAQCRFLDRIDVSGLSDYGDRTEADEMIAILLEWFTALQQKSAPDYQRYPARLLKVSRHKQRTRAYIERSRQTQGDFTNLGGVDIELCHVARFWPRFRLDSGMRYAGKHENVVPCPASEAL